MRNRLILWSVTAAMAGFLFGFDTVVISGAESTIQELWQLQDLTHGVAMSAALWGTVLGSMIGGIPTDAFGRRKTLLWIGVLYFVSAIWSGLATDPYSFMVARFIGGLGVGISTVTAPLYISEISPPSSRGKLAGMFQFNIVFGILVAFLSNFLLAQLFPAGPGDEPSVAWRWMLGVEAIPALIYSLMCLGLPESPRWLIAERGEREAGLVVLQQVMPDQSPAEIEALADEIEAATQQTSAAGTVHRSKLLLPFALAFLIAFFNQLSGINAILYFAPRIFELTGLGKEAALLQSVGIGVTNLIFTFVGLALIDRLGRKTLMLIGSLGYIASLGLCAWAFQSENYSIVAPCIFAFIAAHAVGQGAVIWVFISEIFPNRYRANGQALGSATHWVFAASLTLVFPYAVEQFPASSVFAFFCGMMVLQLLWVILMMPETKGVPLEDIERKLGIHE
ncbi:sugar porter family MFS transporter [Blastopirellula marina]|uniref:MFS transporter n=1 Tax=Blastopirellula marina TaxID=124 RepID=A0A2S8GNV8_9BACT|nr:sugar porter family MFS transporter [Blastopirellula marina]PQO46108.1 MFS transporter [Blastopirellula marina]